MTTMKMTWSSRSEGRWFQRPLLWGERHGGPGASPELTSCSAQFLMLWTLEVRQLRDQVPRPVAFFHASSLVLDPVSLPLSVSWDPDLDCSLRLPLWRSKVLASHREV